MPDQALSHLKVLDLTHYIAGPYCTKLLAGLGAEVIKVEKPDGGDGARRIGPFFKDDPHQEKSGPFFFLNSNKKSITLNLRTAVGVKIFKKLVREADVLVENFEPRVMPSLGLDYHALERINPRLVMTSISNFGQTGPYRDYKATEIVALATGGVMYPVGNYDREPLKLGLSTGQYLAGITAAAATMSAVYARGEEELGQHVDVSIMESIMQCVFLALGTYSYIGAVRRRKPKVGSGELGTFPTADGYIRALFLGYLDWGTFARTLFKCAALDDPKFETFLGRTIHMEELKRILLPLIEKRSTQELFHSAQELGFPFGPVQNPKDIVNCSQLQARGYYAEVAHPMMGKLSYPGAPFKMSETPWQEREPAPLLGQHNEDIYCGRLGYIKHDLVRLREREVI